MFSMPWLVVVLLALVGQMAAAEDFEMASGAGTIRGEDRDPFKEGYFHIVLACFLLMFFFIGCMFSVRLCLGKRRGNESQSFFLVA